VVAAVRRGSGQLGYVSWLVPVSALPLSVAESRGLVLLAEMFFDALDRVRPPEPGHRLSVIERRCLGWSAYGCTDKEIAAEMQRSMDTIRFHMKNILKKLGAANRTHAVAVAMQQGLIRLGSTPRRTRARAHSGKRKRPPAHTSPATDEATLIAHPAAARPGRRDLARPTPAIDAGAPPQIRRTPPRRPRTRAHAPA
jgi:DNA-binding CsgD family transcriptional regulator